MNVLLRGVVPLFLSALLLQACADHTPECIPDCQTVQCGPDPVCGIDCGGCREREICNTEGQCECRYYDCEGTCCELGQVCHQGSCRAPVSCDDRNCDAGEVCNAAGLCECRHLDCDGTCCDFGQTCYQNSCCTPVNCIDLGASCGVWADGCGIDLFCGECGNNETCSKQGVCECSYLECNEVCCEKGEECHNSACLLTQIIDDFEDGELVGWARYIPLDTLEIVDGGANGTAKSLSLSDGNANGNVAWRDYFDENTQVDSVSFYMRKEGSGNTYSHAYLQNTNLVNGVDVALDHVAGSAVYHDGNNYVTLTTLNVNIFHKFDLVFDWLNSDYDIYVDDVLQASDVPFKETPFYGMYRLIIGEGFGNTIFIDEIVITLNGP